MEVSRSTRLGKHLAAALAVAVFAGLSATPAAANHDVVPAAYFSLASYQPNAANAATQHASGLIASEGLAAAEFRPGLYRARNFVILNVSREIKLLKEDLVVRLKSPGKRNSIVMVEFRF
ncbi:MAG: hypothetical protein IH881_03910 [Myxococcales bacterium]|nr:hypothetical protein [Myxococcales bacterium]